MPQRKHDVRSAGTADANSRSDTPSVVLTPPTEDEEKYLRSIEQSNSDYNPEIILGGPRVARF